MKKYEHYAYISIFENTKQNGSNPPVYTGMVTMPDGTNLQVALWHKTSKAGNQYLGGAIQKEVPDPEVVNHDTSAPHGINVNVRSGGNAATSAMPYQASSNGIDGDLPF